SSPQVGSERLLANPSRGRILTNPSRAPDHPDKAMSYPDRPQGLIRGAACAILEVSVPRLQQARKRSPMIPRVLLLPLVLLALTSASVNAVLINKSVKRVIDLTKHVVRVQSDIQFIDNEKDVGEYTIAFPGRQDEHLAHLTAKCGKNVCEVVRSKGVNKVDIAYYSVVLKNKVAKGEVGSVKVTAYFTHVLKPFPEEITQRDDQLVVYEDSHVLLSPYPTESQSTKLKLPSGKVESFSEVQPVTRKGSTLTYGPYENVQPFEGAADSMRIHYKNHSPFMTVTTLVKEIEVSMWGRVAVEEVYDLLHSGAKLKGGFSRYEYTAHNARSASFYEMIAHLPKESVNVYYRDQIGNVSTSRLRETETRQELEFKPRFPIFGGWKTQWYFGYSVPTHSVLTRSGNKFKLEMDFSTSVEGAAVDDLTVKVILPEGATNARVNLPFAVDSQSSTSRQTYLDTPLVGRPVLVIKKKNVIAQHNVPFEVTFEFPQSFMLHEPLLLVSGFLAFFLFCMVLFRLDLSLVKKPANKKKTDTWHGEAHTRWMPGTNTGDLAETTVGLTWKTRDTPTGNHTLETVTLGDTNDIDHLVLGEDGRHWHLLFEERLGEVDLVGDRATVDLNLHEVSLLLAKLDLAHLANDANNHHWWGLEDGDGLNDLLLVHLRARAVDFTQDVGHASLVAHEGAFEASSRGNLRTRPRIMDDLDAILNSMAKASGNVLTEDTLSSIEKTASTEAASKKRPRDETPVVKQAPVPVDAKIWNPHHIQELSESVTKSIQTRASAYNITPAQEIARQQTVRLLCNKIKQAGEQLGVAKLPNSAYETWQFTSKLTVAENDPLIPHAGSDYSGLLEELVKAGANKKNAIAQCKVLTKEADKLLKKFSQQDFSVGKKKVKVDRSEDMVMLSYGNSTSKVSTDHFDKLKALYARHQGVDRWSPQHQRKFETAAFALALRYDSLDGGGFQAALNEECFDVLLKHFDCKMECFASPLNCRYGRFCSAFLDTDHTFGSVGSFFEFAPTSGCFEANPPFIPKLIKRMADHMTNVLEKASEPLAFIIIIPAWKETEGWQKLHSSRFNRRHVLLPQKDHGYCEGKQQIRKTRWRIASFDTSVFFWQNAKAAAKWQVTDEIVDELRVAFKSKQKEERETLGLRKSGKRVKHNKKQ
ncbi:TPA: hypothetical protein N0F65_001843, partial [Lagenidium giganteum]